jgi:hypothetical protein
MPTHNVVQGECICSLADRFGLLWKEIYDHPANAKLRRLRPDPEILYPGDEVYIPDPGKKEELCQTAKTHRFVVKAITVELRIVLADQQGNPLANKKFLIHGEGVHVAGKTSATGLIVASIPANLESASLSAWIYGSENSPHADIEYDLQIGHLDPKDTITGIQSRLNNLGFRCPTTGEDDKATQRALARYRQAHQLPETAGIHDPGFRNGLVKRHERSTNG